MPYKQLFLVTRWGEKKRPSPATKYVAAKWSEPMWAVGLISGHFPGQKVGFYFESEAEAAHFSLWQIYDPQTILQAVSPDRKYVAGQVYQSFANMIATPYTDAMTKQKVWIVPMADAMNRNFLDLQFPNEEQARQFKTGFPYRAQDLFGTTIAVPNDASGTLQAAANIAAMAKDTAAKAQVSAKQIQTANSYDALAKYYDNLAAAYENATMAAQSRIAEADAAAAASGDANAAAGYANAASFIGNLNPGAKAAAKEAQAAAVKAVAAAIAAAAYLARPPSIGLHLGSDMPTAMGAFGTYFIVNGGSEGYYIVGGLQTAIPAAFTVADLLAAGMAFCAAGTFTQPYNGFLTGAFAADANSRNQFIF